MLWCVVFVLYVRFDPFSMSLDVCSLGCLFLLFNIAYNQHIRGAGLFTSTKFFWSNKCFIQCVHVTIVRRDDPANDNCCLILAIWSVHVYELGNERPCQYFFFILLALIKVHKLTNINVFVFIRADLPLTMILLCVYLFYAFVHQEWAHFVSRWLTESYWFLFRVYLLLTFSLIQWREPTSMWFWCVRHDSCQYTSHSVLINTTAHWRWYNQKCIQIEEH